LTSGISESSDAGAGPPFSEHRTQLRSFADSQPFQ
jgi:hypothetical protein